MDEEVDEEEEEVTQEALAAQLNKEEVRGII